MKKTLATILLGSALLFGCAKDKIVGEEIAKTNIEVKNQIKRSKADMLFDTLKSDSLYIEISAIAWEPNLAYTLKYTNGKLTNGILYSNINPQENKKKRTHKILYNTYIDTTNTKKTIFDENLNFKGPYKEEFKKHIEDKKNSDWIQKMYSTGLHSLIHYTMKERKNKRLIKEGREAEIISNPKPQYFDYFFSTIDPSPINEKE